MEAMTMWSPPTPPQEEDDVYIDQSLCHLYGTEPLLDSQLPPVYVKKELKRPRVPEISNTLDGRRSIKLSRRDDAPISAPRSLFDHPSSALQKMRRDVKMHRYRGLVRNTVSASLPMAPISARDENVPDWTVHEDWALLQTVQDLQGLPLNLMVLTPAHTPNWDLVADMVNQVSSTTRSPAQCRIRYETVIIPREEGKMVFEQKKQKKKTSVLHKMIQQKSSRPLRTKQLQDNDNNAAFTEIYQHRIDGIKSLSLTRKPTPRPLLVNPSLKNPKHAAVLMESGIAYDTPLNPIEIATRRADRIAKDKKMQVTQVPQTVQAVHTLTPEQMAQQQRLVAAAVASKAAAVAAAQSSNQTHASSAAGTIASPASAVVTATQVLQAVAASTGTLTTPAPTQSIVVAAGSSLNSVMQTTGITTLASGLRQTRPLASLPVNVGIQEMVVQSSQARTVSNSTPTVVSVANLTPAQLQARIATGSLVSLPATAVKAAGGTVGSIQVSPGQKATLSSAQVSYYRQQAILRQQTQRITMRDQQQVKVVQGQKVGQVVQAGTAGSQPKTQYLKQTATGVVKGRQEDISALVKQQLQRQQQQKAAGQQQTITTQFLTSAGMQLQGTPVATIVKSSAGSSGHSVSIPLPNITIPQLKTTVAGSQQIRQLGIATNYQQLLSKQGRVQTKVTQLAKPGGVPTQLIVQSQSGKGVPTISMQHIQQVIKNVQPQHMVSGQAGGSQVVLAKSAGGTATLSQRVIPGSQTPRQTIQVVPGTIRTVASVSQVANSNLASALAGSIKVAQGGAPSQTYISQVASLPGIVRQTGVSPVRIQTATSASGTPLMAVTVQQQSNIQQPTAEHHGQGQS